VAWCFIEEHGFDALTMRSLGQAMGVSASAVSTSFPEREQRRRRYRALSHAAFDEHSRSADDIGRLNEDAFEAGLAAILDHLESRIAG
jgi:AcrR family transcriptional regulator